MNSYGNTRRAIRKLWSWLGGLPLDTSQLDEGRQPELLRRCDAAPGVADAMLPSAVATAAPDRPSSNGVVLQFPLHGEALLVRLAAVLRNRLADRGLERNPLQLTMSRCPWSRLSIDSNAYVEFDADRSTYHVVLDAGSDTTITLETRDFDAAVNFVVQYISERLSEPAGLEAAS